MFGDNAPAATWYYTFTHAALGPPLAFVPVPPTSQLFSMGNGQSVPKPKNNNPGPGKPKPGGGGPPTGGHH